MGATLFRGLQFGRPLLATAELAKTLIQITSTVRRQPQAPPWSLASSYLRPNTISTQTSHLNSVSIKYSWSEPSWWLAIDLHCKHRWLASHLLIHSIASWFGKLSEDKTLFLSFVNLSISTQRRINSIICCRRWLGDWLLPRQIWRDTAGIWNSTSTTNHWIPPNCQGPSAIWHTRACEFALRREAR